MKVFLRAFSIVVGSSALTFSLGCPEVEPPLDDGGPVADAGVDPKDGGNDPDPDAGPEPPPTCGNGTVEAPEQCDDGNTIQTDSCKNDCTYNICGDGYVYTGVEECDVGDTLNGDGCSAVCLVEAPPLPDYVTLSGQVKNRKYADGSGYSQYVTVRALGAQLCVDNANPGQYKACTAAPPTGADGAYSVNYLQPQSTFYLDLRIDDPTYQHPDQPAGSWVTRLKGYTKDQATEALNPYYIPFDWMQQVADDCGVYDAAQFTKANPELFQRTIVFGQLKDKATGAGIAGVTKAQISVRIGEYVNQNQNYVCFLNVDGNNLVGTASNTSYAEAGGAFVVFKLVNQAGGALGNGNAYVNAGPTFEEASIGLAAGNVGVVTLYSNDGVPPPVDLVDFSTQVYPLFTTLGCVNCHYEGGPGGLNNNNGYYAIYGGEDVSPEDVYNNLTGPGTNCTVTDYVGNYRVCVNDPAASRLLHRPLLQDPPNGHPNSSFADEYDPNYVLVKAWIEQGAVYNAIPQPPPENVYTLYGVMDVASQRGCTACHGYNIDYGGTGRPAGNLALNGCEQYYIDNGTYTANGIDYDPATNPDYYKRDCVYYHLKNAAVDDDPYDYGYRVNPDYPERSMLLRNPYCGPYYCADDPNYPETHPVKVFANDQDPGYLNIYSWIEDGAQNNGSADELYIQQ